MPDVISDSESVMLTDTSTPVRISKEKDESDITGVGKESERPELEMEDMPVSGESEGKKIENSPLNSNTYATKKTVAQGMLDLALLTSNASQLKMLLKFTEERGAIFVLHVSCLSISIILQVFVGVLLIMNSRYNINRQSHQSRADIMNNMTVVGIFLITVVNVLASSFGETT